MNSPWRSLRHHTQWTGLNIPSAPAPSPDEGSSIYMGTWEQPPLLLPHACIFSPVPRGFFLPILYLHSLLTLTSQLPPPAGPLPQPAPSHTVSAASLLSPIQALLATKKHFLNTNLFAISSTYPRPLFFCWHPGSFTNRSQPSFPILSYLISLYLYQSSGHSFKQPHFLWPTLFLILSSLSGIT